MKQNVISKEAKELWSFLERASKKEDERHRKADARHRKFNQMMDRMSKEADIRKKEADERAREADKRAEEARIETKALKKRMKELNELFTGQWGKLMESLIQGDLVKLLNERGIKVNDVAREREKTFKGKNYEFDMIAIDGKEVVVVEVKTTMKKQDVDDFLEKLKEFKTVFSRHKKDIIYGAIAYLKANEGSNTYAQKQGLFVIRAVGNSASIINRQNFKPKVF